MQSIVEDRYRVAGAESFDTTWIAPGFVHVAKGKPLTAAMWSKKRQAGADGGSEAHAELEVFTDGSGGDGSTAAGWGFVGVRNEAEVHAARTALAYRIIITIVPAASS